MKHKEKIKLARKILSRKERENNTPIFQSNEWEKRREAKKLKVKKQQIKYDK